MFAWKKVEPVVAPR